MTICLKLDHNFTRSLIKFIKKERSGFFTKSKYNLLYCSIPNSGIPFGLILAKKFGSIDITEVGSGSIGATNVLRAIKEENPTLAKKLAIATLALDALKGLVVLLIAKILGASEATLWAMAILSVVGHCYSPYLKFEGGKGVATGMGVLIFMLPIETIIALIVWFISAKTIKISSISSLTALLL